MIENSLDNNQIFFDDDENEFLEFDVENESGFLIGFTEDEIERIDIIG